jgi:hypothetical protein
MNISLVRSTVFFLSFLFLTSNALAEEIGLLCPPPNTAPRIILVDIEAARSSHFSLSRGVWVTDMFQPDVRVNEIIFMPVSLNTRSFTLNTLPKGQYKIHLNRTTLEVETRLNIDNIDVATMQSYSCTVYTSQEIRQIAQREFARINNTRQL